MTSISKRLVIGRSVAWVVVSSVSNIRANFVGDDSPIGPVRDILEGMPSSPHVLAVAFALVTVGACSKDEPSHGSSNNGNDGGAFQSDNTGGPSTPASKMNTTTENVDVDGTSRDYIRSVPKTYAAGRSYPLLVALHGDGQDAASFRGELGIEGFIGDDAIVAYTDHSEDLFTPYDQNNDQRLIEVVIDAIKAKFSIDASKVWGLGYSKGGYQLNEIACRKPGLIKAMAIHAGGAPQEVDADGNPVCPKAIGLPMFATHGGNDDPAGGEFAASYWASRAGCGSTRSPTTPSICEAYDNCPPSKPVVFCVVPGQPHYPLYKNAAADSWAWFKKL
jgi:polyhydroxybutyrate depolymerase